MDEKALVSSTNCCESQKIALLKRVSDRVMEICSGMSSICVIISALEDD
jgi:hypothetical protein